MLLVNNEQSRHHDFFLVSRAARSFLALCASFHSHYTVVIHRMRIYYTAPVKNKTIFGLNSIGINRIRLSYKSRPCLSNQDFSVCIMPLFPNYMHCTACSVYMKCFDADCGNMMQSWILGILSSVCGEPVSSENWTPKSVNARMDQVRSSWRSMEEPRIEERGRESRGEREWER